MVALVTVYIDQKTGDWTIERHAVSKRTGFTVATGNVEKIKRSDVERKAPTVISTALATFGAMQDPELSDIDALPRPKRDAFLRSQTIVDIFNRDTSAIVVQLMRKKGSGRIGDPKGRIMCKSESFANEVVSAVRQVVVDD